ncbi:MAG TPA: DUF6519 domain-containing protein [Thermoanaerobaculia bacterium]|jgi:hypothetical protein
MKGDFTRLTHDSAKRYSKVRKQQGRADLDADFNEQVDIQAHRTELETIDVVGQTGFPKGNGCAVSVLANGTLQIAPGRAYVDGLLAELQGTGPIDYLQQPDLPNPPALAPVIGRSDIVYLDVWERHLTAHQDPEIKEVALGGADTCTRVQVVSQIKLLKNIGDAVTCASTGWAPPPSGGRMSTLLDLAATPDDLCTPLPSGAFRGLENRLYRVEIHQAGGLGTAQFKWSRDNGSVTFGVKQFRPNEANRVELVRMGRDQTLTLVNGTHVEILGDERELHSQGGTFTTVDAVDAPTRVVTFTDPVDTHKNEAHPIVRRWDGPLQTVAAEVDLELGIKVAFSGSNFQVGDYWLFTARTAESGGLEILTNAEPHGVRHHYAKLAIVSWSKTGQNWTPAIVDCRPQFPPLTDINAEDVGFTSNVCQFGPGVDTVQEALEVLCQRKCCSLVAVPGPGWESVFNQIADGQSAQICFRVGDYPVNAEVVVANKGHLELHGTGPASRIRANQGECAIRFVNCASVTARELHVGAAQTANGNALNGALTFTDCGSVTLRDLDLECASSTRRRASCVTINNTFPVPLEKGLVEVESCDFKIGDQQVGLLVVNSRNVSVLNNRMRVGNAAPFAQKLQDFDARAGFVDALYSGLSLTNSGAPVEDDPPAPDPDEQPAHRGWTRRSPNVSVAPPNDDGKRVRFLTQPTLVSSWPALILAQPAANFANPKTLEALMYKLATQILFGPPANAANAFKNWRASISSIGFGSPSQGITIAGRIADQVRISGNFVNGPAQGIHVGVSHADPARTDEDMAGRIVIDHNRIIVFAQAGATRSWHGIFVGNASSIVVRDNHLQLVRSAGTVGMNIDAIRLFGFFGRFINVRENHAAGFNFGTTVVRRGATPSSPMWQVVDNMFESADIQVRAESPVVKTPNFS